MLAKGTAKKVTIYVNQDTREHLTPLYESILDFLLHKGVSGATATRALAGFGAHRLVHTPKVEVLADHLPVRIEFIDTAEKVDQLLPTLYDMVTDGLIEVQDTTIVKVASKEKSAAEPKTPHLRQAGKAKMMRVYLGEADRWNGDPLYDAILKRLRMLDIAGATVYRGILGYGAKGHTHKQGLLHLSRDLPIMISVVETEEKLARAAEEIEKMLGDGLIAISDVDIIRLVHSLPEAADAGLPGS
jgi:PII-like signaling protein